MDIDKYIGIPYDYKNMDCAAFVAKVLQEAHGKELVAPTNSRTSYRSRNEAVAASRGVLAERLEKPEEGCIVLMYEAGQDVHWHLGLYYLVDYYPQVLHSSARIGSSSLDKLSDLKSYGLEVEGFYKCK